MDYFKTLFLWSVDTISHNWHSHRSFQLQHKNIKYKNLY